LGVKKKKTLIMGRGGAGWGGGAGIYIHISYFRAKKWGGDDAQKGVKRERTKEITTVSKIIGTKVHSQTKQVRERSGESMV